MANDMTPKRGYEFKSKQQVDPNRLDIELDRIYGAFQSIQEFLSKTHDPTGLIKTNTVGKSALKPQIFQNLEDEITRSAREILDQQNQSLKSTQSLVGTLQGYASQAADARQKAEQALSQSLTALAKSETVQKDVLSSRGRTERALQNASARQQDAETSASSARLAEDMAYRWAEKLDGPVFVPTGGNPVDDGFYSSKWWARFTETNVNFGSYWYLGTHPAPPTEGNDGAPLQKGMWYFDTTRDQTYIFNGVGWEAISGVVGDVRSVFGRQGDIFAEAGDYDEFYVPKVGGWQHPFQGDVYINDITGDLSQFYFVGQDPTPEHPTGYRVGALQFDKRTSLGAIVTFDGTQNSAPGAVYYFPFSDPTTGPYNANPRNVLTVETGVSKFQQANQVMNGGNLHIEKASATLRLNADTATNPQLFWRSTADGVAFDEWNALLQNWDGRLTLRHNNAVKYAFDTNPFVPSASGVLRRDVGDARYYTQSEVYTQSEADARFARWQQEWSPAPQYEANDVVRDGAYLVVATAPNINDKPVIEEEPVYPGADANIVSQTPVSEQVYWTGQEYFVQDAWYVDGFRFYTPPGDFEFTVIYRVRNEDGTLQKVKQASAWQTYGTDGWKELTLPSFLLLDGQRLEIWLGTRAVAQASEVLGNWTTSNTNGGTPAAGEAYFRNNASEIQFNVTDGDAGDRTTELASIPVGASLDFGGLSWTVSSVTNDASTYTFIIQPSQGRPAEGTYLFQWSWGAPDPLPYVADTTWWQNNQSIRGSVGTEIVDDMTETDAQYGVDILMRQVQLSENWDIMAVSGVSGGSGPSTQIQEQHNEDGSGYQIVGKTLRCWGFATGSGTATPTVVTFPKTFARNPAITLAQANTVPHTRDCGITNPTSSSFELIYRLHSDGSDLPNTAYWQAVGEWDGVS